MREIQHTSREGWLLDAIHATRDFMVAERAENAYDLRCAAPDSSDYDRAVDSDACLDLTDATLAAMEAELAERRRRRDLRGAR